MAKQSYIIFPFYSFDEQQQPFLMAVQTCNDKYTPVVGKFLNDYSIPGFYKTSKVSTVPLAFQEAAQAGFNNNSPSLIETFKKEDFDRAVKKYGPFFENLGVVQRQIFTQKKMDMLERSKRLALVL